MAMNALFYWVLEKVLWSSNLHDSNTQLYTLKVDTIFAVFSRKK